MDCPGLGGDYRPIAPRHCLRTIHAEQNVVIRAARSGTSVRDTTLYTTMEPCFTCAKILIGVGVYRVVAAHRYHDAARARAAFADAGVVLVTRSSEELYVA